MTLHTSGMWFFRRLVQRFRPEQARPDRRDRPNRPDRLAAYNTYDARNVLSQLIARAASGEAIVIARAGVPVVKLVPYAGEPIRPGLIRTHLVVSAPKKSSEGHPESAYEMSSSSDPSGSRK
jgi:prevent-host-death family protein